jgi:hypothetical protein
MPPVSWSDEVDDVLAGDITAALAYLTPARGAVVTAVSPIGLRDREAGTVRFTTSLGLGKKLERIRRNPRVALAYHAREHGFSGSPFYVLVQGDASIAETPDQDYLENVVGPAAERFMGPRKQGLFWDRWLQEYYRDRIPVTVDVTRIVVWPDLRCRGEAQVLGAPLPETAPESQSPPRNGTGPRVDAERAARRLGGFPHTLLAYAAGDGYPTVAPVSVLGAEQKGIRLGGSSELIPAGGRRAGILGHSYKQQLLGISARQYTGWLDAAGRNGEALYAPQTEQGFRAPTNKTLLMLANGFVAKRGLRRARREGTAAPADAPS